MVTVPPPRKRSPKRSVQAADENRDQEHRNEETRQWPNRAKNDGFVAADRSHILIVHPIDTTHSEGHETQKSEKDAPEEAVDRDYDDEEDQGREEDLGG